MTNFTIAYLPSRKRWTLKVGKRRFQVRSLKVSCYVENSRSGLQGKGFITVFPADGEAVLSDVCHVSHYNGDKEIHL